MIPEPKYIMTISRLTVDKLGVKLYDRVSAVIAEIVANSYDADATKVEIKAPMGELLAKKEKGQIIDRGFVIEVVDNGTGMTFDEVNAFYLIVGAERRNDPKRGDRSKIFSRRVLGRKGVGKLAPFGVCQKIEVITVGGELISGKDENDHHATGYLTAHLILDRGKILSDTDEVYYPDVGNLDGIIRPERGTTIRLSVFDHRRVPDIEDFERQMAQRFGLATSDWKIILIDSQRESGDGFRREVGQFNLTIKSNTKIVFDRHLNALLDSRNQSDYYVRAPDEKDIPGFQAGFNHEDVFFPITGWAAYAEKPYKDDLMAGIRIYCRGKIAAQTAVFNLRAGFTGEHDIRSYLIGELHADWLDEMDDLIRTDRQDILWSNDLGQAFQAWGQKLVREIGKITREPMRRDAWEIFQQLSDIKNRVEKTFPGKEQQAIRSKTLDIAKTIAKTARRDELEDREQVEAIVQLSLLLGPHITLDEKLREAAESKDRPLGVISEVLKTARIAELSSFGRIADDRIKVIQTLEELKDEPGTLEDAFQRLLSAAPWLINPMWSPITANQSFETLKQEFQKFYRRRTGEDLNLGDFPDPKKRADFVLSSQDNAIQIIEIKRPNHALENKEMERIQKYVNLMKEFLDDKANVEFKNQFPKFHVTLVCDDIALTGVHQGAFSGLKREGLLTHINWQTFLLRTRRMHEEFLNEAERQRKLELQEK